MTARPRLPRWLTATLAGVVFLAGVVLFFCAFAYGLSGLQEQRSQQELYAEFRGLLDPSSQVAPSVGGAIAPGTPIALVNAPAAGIHDLVVVEGTSGSQLMSGPGHLPDSPLPGQAGDSVLVGRSATAGAPFAGVAGLTKGEVVTVTTGQGTFRFVVERRRVPGDPLPALASGHAMVTFVTSAGSGWLGRLVPSHLVYVDAVLRGKAVAAPAGAPASVAPAEVQGHGDSAAWPYAVFWLEALVAGVLGAAWLWSRWGRVQTWLVGAPVLLALAWGLSNELMRLLPNVY